MGGVRLIGSYLDYWTNLISPLQYTQLQLDRADELRRHPDQLQKLMHDPNCRVVPVFENKNLLTSDLEPVIAKQSELKAKDLIHDPGSFLGLDGQTPYFSTLCSEKQAQVWRNHYPNADFIDLRAAGPNLANNVASILAYARGLSYWQTNNKFCSRCGGENQLVAGGHTMKCMECARECFPRTDPAVIMMVEHTDSSGNKKCLLGRSPAWPEGCFSTLAGFVETGESLESAVAREVFEETGIKVVSPRYVASQPWPFPQSIMLGFVATATTTDIVLDEKEMAEAQWFTANEIKQFGEWSDASEGSKLPRIDSIARLLIDRWVIENT